VLDSLIAQFPAEHLHSVAVNATVARPDGSPMPRQRPIFRITYQRPWGQCVVNTAQFQTEAELRVGFAKSYPGCELVLVEDVTKYFLPKTK
jgi:hypothetical protein